jgi:hypothetical protein
LRQKNDHFYEEKVFLEILAIITKIDACQFDARLDSSRSEARSKNAFLVGDSVARRFAIKAPNFVKKIAQS